MVGVGLFKNLSAISLRNIPLRGQADTYLTYTEVAYFCYFFAQSLVHSLKSQDFSAEHLLVKYIDLHLFRTKIFRCAKALLPSDSIANAFASIIDTEGNFDIIRKPATELYCYNIAATCKHFQSVEDKPQNPMAMVSSALASNCESFLNLAVS